MFRFVFLCLILLMGEQYTTGSPVTEYEYIQEVDAFLRLHIVPATWQDAGLRCYLEGGILASPTTSALTTAMTDMMQAHKLFTRSVFTGIRNINTNGEFISMDGVPLANMPLEWAEGQPDNAGNAENCLALTGAGALANVSCGSVLPYFCRKEAPASAVKSAKISANKYTDAEDDDTSDTTAYDLGPRVVQSDSWNINNCATEEGYEWEPRTGSCYKFHTNSRSWRRALQTCHAEGGHLAIINSETESQVLKEIFTKRHDDTVWATNDDYASIGIWKLQETDSKWLTIHGETLSEAGFDEWHAGEPNNYKQHEYCGAIFPDGLLNDIPCSNGNTFPFICEITPLTILLNIGQSVQNCPTR